jgi:hypothetical protein
MAQPSISQGLLARAYGADDAHRRVSIFLRVQMIADRASLSDLFDLARRLFVVGSISNVKRLMARMIKGGACACLIPLS